MSQIFGVGAEGRIRASPVLPRGVYHLRRQALDLARSKRLPRPFMRGLKIFMRPGASQRPVHIRSVEDLSLLGSQTLNSQSRATASAESPSVANITSRSPQTHTDSSGSNVSQPLLSSLTTHDFIDFEYNLSHDIAPAVTRFTRDFRRVRTETFAPLVEREIGVGFSRDGLSLFVVDETEVGDRVVTRALLDLAVATLSSALLAAADLVAPLSAPRPASRRKPWVTSQIRGLIRERDRVYRLFRRGGSSAAAYKELRSRVRNLLDTAKNRHLASRIAEAADMQSRWRALRSMGVSSPRLPSPLTSFSADELCSHYVAVGSRAPPLDISMATAAVPAERRTVFDFRHVVEDEAPLVTPHLDYPAPLLTDLTKEQTLALQRLQKRLQSVTYTARYPGRAHVTPYRLALGWLSAEGRREVINCSLASRIIRDASPGYLRSGFRVIGVPTETEEIRQSARRRPPVLYYKAPRTASLDRSFAFSSAIAINQ
ncbi:unnamed protein product [Trichogramma brassicae]|uniref:Uncharacterized protein n=1 Tax=Trichogramma brassicae TaxID=86971 RepID=A0A6H5I2X2_9HYME|nr:unnamed protein product [Trichogramma brassicae]